MQNTPATSSTAPRIRQAVRTANAKTAPPALPRAPLLHGLNRAVLWQLAACGIGLLLSAGQVYGGAAPFGLGLLLGCGNTYAPAAALGCLAGLLLFQPLDTALKLAGACIGALTARIVGRQLGQTGFLPGAACGVGVLLLEQGLVTLVGGASPADTASLLCSAALAVLVGLGIHKLHIGTPRGACLWAAMAAACLQRAALPGFAPGLAGAAFCILCCACAGSLEHTAVLALVLAMALTAAAPALCFAALAVAAGDPSASNLLATSAALSQTSLEQMMIQIRQAEDPRKKKIRLTPKKLIVAPGNMLQAEVLLKSVLRAGTNNNDLNPIKSMGMLSDVAVLSRLTSATAWFVQTDAENGLQVKWRRKIEKSMEGDFETDSVRYKSTMRLGSGWTDWRSVFGTPGT